MTLAAMGINHEPGTVKEFNPSFTERWVAGIRFDRWFEALSPELQHVVSQCPVCGGPLEALTSELGWTSDPAAARVVGWLCLWTNLQVGTRDGSWVHFTSEPFDDED